MGHAADAGRDRLSNLRDDVLGHILSFLDAKEAGRAAALSSRWRDVLGSVHTVSLEQPERPYFIYDRDSLHDRGVARRLIAAVNAALFSRDRRPYPAAAAVPLRALRVSLEGYEYDPDDKSRVDLYLSYALRHAAPEFDLDLRFGRESACGRYDRLDAADADDDGNVAVYSPIEVRAVAVNPPRKSPESNDHYSHRVRPEDEDDVSSSDDDERVARPWNRPSLEYTVLSGLFSCATLRSLRLGYCRLSPPVAIRLPSLETLHLTHVPDEEEHLQRLISSCPRLADLTLEACGTMTALSLLDNMRLRRLALRCCHRLARLAVDAPELHCLEYRGPVPDDSFLTVRGGGGGFPAVTSCKIDILEEATSEEELANLGSFLQQSALTTKHLHLCSARMGSCFVKLPAFPSLRHLELNGSVPRTDDPVVVAAWMSSILRQAPNLEFLSLFFEAAPRADGHFVDGGHSIGELLDAHHLHYSRYDTLDYAPAMVPACLGSRVRKMELLQYQGGRAQRTLARFLLRNAPVLEQLYCGLAEGPEWVQRELMREMEGWVVNETASKEFH
ncbi:uncharacterized protein [Aegilops tauschii subsp. strangulata]|uniref:uncharacterized protein n=1 Tax=Aegilops tauschii subsp. strangulata TaxID=200361 RepID=UPI003CC8C7EB